MNNTGNWQTDQNFCAEGNTQCNQPVDPNEIIGSEGYNAPESTDTLRWVSATQSLAYTIYFENDAELAMAAASKVTITVPLHEKLNYATFGVGSFGFGSHIIAVEGSPSSYQTRIDLRDSMGIYLDVVAGLDIVHNEAFWIFQSIDPATGLPPTDIHLGFLPINDSLHSGEGFVSFTIKPKAGECVTGDTISATATIVFDVNEAIPTNTWVNTIDAVAPTSTLTVTPNAAGDMLTATFAGEDDAGGCGIKQYKLYYSVNGSAYQLYDVYPAGSTAEIPVETGMEYEFFTLAEDNVGNCEPMKNQPEYSIGINFVTLAVNAFPQEAGTVTGGGTYSVNDIAQLTATAAEGYHFVNWMSHGVPVSTNNPYSAAVSQNQTYTAYFERNAYTLQTLAAVGSSITVVDLNGNEVPSGSTVLHFDRLIVSTDTADCYAMESVLLNGVAYVPGDTLTVTGDIVLTTQTEPLIIQTDTTATACELFVWYGETLTETAEYTKTFTNAAGCDSVVTLYLTINHGIYTETTVDTCGTEYYWALADTTVNQSGMYYYYSTNANTCTDTAVLVLSLYQSATTELAAQICAVEVYDQNGFNASTAGDHYLNLQTAHGCDSIVHLTLTVNSGTYTETLVDTCGTEYYWALADTTVNQSGMYYYFSNNANTCIDTAVLMLSLYQSATTELSAQICAGEVYDQNGFNVGTAGDHYLNLQTENGCDSTVVLHLAVGSEAVTYLAASICEGDSYQENGFEIVAPSVGTHMCSDTIGRVGTCDSIVHLTLTVNRGTYTETAVDTCGTEYYWTLADTTVNQSGTYYHYSTNANTCTDTAVLMLALYQSATTELSAQICGGEVYDQNGFNASTAGDHYLNLQTEYGCDSIVHLTLTVNHGTYAETTVDTCGSEYYWTLADTTVNQSGIYYYYSTNANTCTDTAVLMLALYQSATMELSAQICAGEVYDQNGFNVSTAGDHYLNLQTVHGCDSTVILHLTVGSEAVTYLAASICEGDSYHENGFEIIAPAAGVHEYSDTIGRVGTCDSIVHLTLTVNRGTYAETTVDTCGIEYYWALADTTVNQSGTYYYYSTNTNTCTDTTVLILSLYQSAMTELSAQICAGEVYDQNGFNASTAGDHYLNLQTAHGCDSIVHLTLIVNHGTYAETTVDTCGTEYYWALADTTVNQSGTYYYYSTNANTCIDTAVLVLSLYQSATTELSAQICVGEVYDQNGFNASTAGDHYLNLQTAHGCDSTVILHLTVGNEAVTYLAASICEGDSYQENGFEIVAPSVGTHMCSDTIGRTGTCDSIVHLTLTVNRGNYTETTVDTCTTEYYWALADTTVNQSGTYYYYSINANTCIDTTVLMLSLYQSVTTELTAQICAGEVYDQNGFNVSTAGDHYLNLQTAHGCDSIVHLTLTVNHGTYAETTVDTCAAEYYWALADTTVNQSGTYYHYSINANTCIDTAVLVLALYQSVTTELSAQICAGEVYDQNGFNASTAGDHYLNLQTENGCDSTVVLHLAVGSEAVTYLAASICEGDSYQENGFEIIAPSVGTHMYSDTIGRPGTCDSIVHLTLTVNRGTYTETAVDTCGTEYYWTLADTTVNQSGTYYHYSTNANTCTDTAVLMLALYQSATTELSAQICAGEVYDQNGFNVSTAGDHYLNLQTEHGCDSTVILHLSVGSEAVTYLAASICEGDSYQENDFEIIAPSVGTHMYSDTIGRTGTCDSIVHLTLTVNRGNYTETTVDTCGTEYYWALADTTVNQSGTYYYYSTNANTCTDTTVLVLALYQSVTTELSAQICAGEVYDQNGFNASTAGDHYLNLQTENGCDSTVVLHLAVGSEAVTYLAASICEGDSYHENGFEIIAPSVGTHIYSDTIGRVGTCDSIVHLTLTVNRGTYTETAVDTCGTEYYWALANTTVNQSGTYYYYSPNTNTCTDTTVLILSLYQSATTELTASICEGEVYDQNGFNVSTAGDHYLNLQTEHGCDSTVILHLTVGSEAVSYLAASICEGDSYQENGFEIIAPSVGTHMYSDTIARLGTCDSVISLTLTVNAATSGDTTAVVNSSFDWYGQHLTTSGDYTSTLTNATGCDSVVTLHLTVNYPVVTGDTTAIACDRFDWYEHTNLTQSGDYVHIFTNIAGGDSVVTLHLTINHSVTEIVEATACDSYTWNGTTYTQSVNYTQTFTNASGCDSTITLHLTIYPTVTEIVEATACDSYTWNGTTYTQSGDYTQTFTNANGCDSVVTLHLTFVESPALQTITGEPEICINQYATYHYDISDPNYQYRWLKDNELWGENVPVMTLHEMGEGVVLVTMQVTDGQSGCAADTSMSVHVANRIAPDTTEVRRKGSSNILVCKPVYSDYGQVHYRWGYTDLSTSAEVVIPGDRNYCLYDFGIDTLSYRYWVETYLNEAVGAGCENRSYYAYGYITTSTPGYGGNIVDAYLSGGRIMLNVSALSPEDVAIALYDMNGKLLLTKGYGVTELVSDVIPVSFAPGIYLLNVNVGGYLYSFKLLKI